MHCKLGDMKKKGAIALQTNMLGREECMMHTSLALLTITNKTGYAGSEAEEREGKHGTRIQQWFSRVTQLE